MILRIKHLIMVCSALLIISCTSAGGGINPDSCVNNYIDSSEDFIVLTTQEDVNNLSGAVDVQGSIYIGACPDVNSSAITSLTPLSSLENINGSLIIKESALKNFEGLNNLKIINGSLTIILNEQLEEVSFFNSLKSVSGINIHGNPKVTKVAGFNLLETCNGSIHFLYNNSLESITGFNALNTVTSFEEEESQFEISNDSLISISGFESLETLDIDLLIHSNSALSSFTAFNNLTHINGSLDISNNFEGIESNTILTNNKNQIKNENKNERYYSDFKTYQWIKIYNVCK